MIRGKVGRGIYTQVLDRPRNQMTRSPTTEFLACMIKKDLKKDL